MTKYLWLVTQNVITDWSTYHLAVVVAETKHEAKRVLPTSRSLSGPITWCAYDYVTAKYLGIARPGLESVICVSHQENKGESK